ncbi:MAG: hypothetical protein OHK0028_10250 [Deltaproteobacteria bacterium]
MKTYTARMVVLAAAAVITLAGSALAGQTMAERQMSKGTLGGTAGHESGVPAPDPNDREYRVGLETGNLPSGAVGLKTGSGPVAEIPTVESGGVDFRVGIDTY